MEITLTQVRPVAGPFISNVLSGLVVAWATDAVS